MQVGETVSEGFGATEGGDEGGHVLGNEKGVHPRTSFVRLVAARIEVTGCEVVEG